MQLLRLFILTLTLCIPMHVIAIPQSKQTNTKQSWYKDVKNWVIVGTITLASAIGITAYLVRKKQKKSNPLQTDTHHIGNDAVLLAAFEQELNNVFSIKTLTKLESREANDPLFSERNNLINKRRQYINSLYPYLHTRASNATSMDDFDAIEADPILGKLLEANPKIKQNFNEMKAYKQDQFEIASLQQASVAGGRNLEASMAELESYSDSD